MGLRHRLALATACVRSELTEIDRNEGFLRTSPERAQCKSLINNRLNNGELSRICDAERYTNDTLV